MVSSSFFATSGLRAVIAALAGTFFTVVMSAPGIAVSRQIDVRPPVYTPGFVDNRGHRPRPLAHRRRGLSFAVPGNSLPISRGCAFSTVPGFNAMVLSHEPVRRQFGKLASQSVNLYGGDGLA